MCTLTHSSHSFILSLSHSHTHTHANVGVLNFVQIFIDVEINTHIYPAELEVLSVSTYLKNKHFSDIFSINELSQ